MTLEPSSTGWTHRSRIRIPPRRSFIICATERSGSSLLCETLGRTGAAPQAIELFGSGKVNSQALSLGIATFEEYFDLVVHEATDDAGTFGVKIMWHQMRDLLRWLHDLYGDPGATGRQLLERAFGEPRFIWITRQDKVRQAVSLYRASETGVWFDRGNRSLPEHPLEFDVEGFDRCFDWVVEDDGAWPGFFEENGIEPFRVVYEDLVNRPEEIAVEILRFAEIPFDEPVQFATPSLRKQADAVSEDWVARYRLFRQGREQGFSPAPATVPPAKPKPVQTLTCVGMLGLCNTLRGMATCSALAEKLGFGFRLYWPLDEDRQSTDFIDLFEEPDFELVEDFPMDEPFLQTQAHLFQTWVRLRKRFILSFARDVEGELKLRDLPRASFAFKTHFSLRPDAWSDETYIRQKRALWSRLCPVPVVREAVDAIAGTFPRNVVGVHIRATDNCWYFKDGRCPGMERYAAAMRRHLQDDRPARFFVCSDNETALDFMRQEFGDRVMTRDQILGDLGADRYTPEGQRLGLIDLLCLARTSRLIGTRFSSFSYEAASIGGIEILELGDAPETGREVVGAASGVAITAG